MESTVAGNVVSVVDLASLFGKCIEKTEFISSAIQFGVNQEIIQVKAEVERVRLLVWGQSLGIASIIDEWFVDGSLDVDGALQKEYVRSAVASLLFCFIKVFENVDGLKKNYGLMQNDPSRESVLSASGNSSETSVLASVFQSTYAYFQENIARMKKNTPPKWKGTWTIVNEDHFRALIGELRGINDSLSSLLPAVQQRARVKMRLEIMRSSNERQLQSLVRSSEDADDFISEAASLRLEMLSASANPVSRESQVRTITPLSEYQAQIDLPTRPVNHSNEGKAEGDSSRSPLAVFESVIEPYDNLGALVIRKVFSSGGWLSCFTQLVGIENAPELSKVKCLSHASMEFMHIPDTLNPIASRLLVMDIESDPKYAGWAPASVSISGFGREFTQWNGIDPSTTEKSWLRATPTKPISLQTILRRWKEITRYGLGEGWTEETGREQVNDILGPSEYAWIDPDENVKIRRQISDLLASLSRENGYPNLETESSIGMLAMRDKIDPRSTYHTVDFLLQMLQAKEISLRLEKDNGYWHGGVTGKVLYDMIAAELWMKNLEESETGGFRVIKEVKDSQMHGIIHLAEELQWPYLSEVREVAQHILDNNASKVQMDVRVWDWMMGLVLPGAFFAVSAFLALHDMSRSIKDSPPIGNVKVRRPDYGFTFPNVSYWRSRSIVGRVLAPLSGVKDIAGWVGPCPAVSSPYSLNGTLINIKCHPPSFTLRESTSEMEADSSTFPLSSHTDTPSVITSTTAETEWEEPLPPPTSTSPCKLQTVRLTTIPVETISSPSGAFAFPPLKTFHLAHLDFQLLSAPSRTMKTLTLYTNSIFISAPACRRPAVSTTTDSTTGTTKAGATHQQAAAPRRQQNHRIDPKSASLYYQRRVLEIPELMSGAELISGPITVINATAEGGEVFARAWCAEKGCCAVVWRAPREDDKEMWEEEGGVGCFKCALMMASKEGLDVGVVICC